MNDLRKLSTPVLQDWWEHYVCPTCMSQEREGWGLCADRWHSVPAVTYECPGSAFSPLSIPEAELQRSDSPEPATVAKYGRVWTPSSVMSRRHGILSYV
jgi:hypothetical protein